jgi:hypothetical protein
MSLEWAVRDRGVPLGRSEVCLVPQCPALGALPSMQTFFFGLGCWSHFWPRLMAVAEIEQGRKTKNTSPQHPLPRKKKPGPIMSACWAFPLAAWNSYFQNCSSPSLAWANGWVSDLLCIRLQNQVVKTYVKVWALCYCYKFKHIV